MERRFVNVLKQQPVYVHHKTPTIITVAIHLEQLQHMAKALVMRCDIVGNKTTYLHKT
jgi:hypothetical protein